MGYYVRVLSTSSECVLFADLVDSLAASDMLLTIEDGEPQLWNQLLLSHTDGVNIASIERNEVSEGTAGEEELDEFRDELEDALPKSSAEWLLDYFDRVRCIYAFQILSGTDRTGGWEAVDTIKTKIWNHAPGILQADSEGFSNESGFHILWQFEDKPTGLWHMGVLKNGQWVHFRMNLGKSKQKSAFLKGEIPPGVPLV
jgi:hypothetical protein